MVWMEKTQTARTAVKSSASRCLDDSASPIGPRPRRVRVNTMPKGRTFPLPPPLFNIRTVNEGDELATFGQLKHPLCSPYAVG